MFSCSESLKHKHGKDKGKKRREWLPLRREEEEY